MSDPNWSDVVLRLTCNGADASTDFTDLSLFEHTVTNEFAVVSTAESKFGGASMFSDLSRLVIASSSGFGFGSNGAFTAECWVKRPSPPSTTRCLFDFRNASDTSQRLILQIYGDGTIGFDYGSSFTQVTSSTGDTILADNVWCHCAWSYDGTTMRCFFDGEEVLSHAVSLAGGSSRASYLCDRYDYGYEMVGYVDDIRVTKGVARYTASFTAPTAELPTTGAPPPSNDAYLAIDGVLDATGVLLTIGEVALVAQLSESGPLGQPSSLARVDFTGAVDPDAPVRYVVDLHTEDGDVRAPVSSWQATQQVDQACYLQCVIPACDPFVDAIGDATSFTVSRVSRFMDGSPVEYPMATSEINDATFTRSPARNTAVLSGYSDAFVAVEDPPALYDRTLRDVRMITSSNSGTRVRCSIDWLLRPAQRAIVDGDEIVVAYINWYANQDDEFMDVGSRNDTGG